MRYVLLHQIRERQSGKALSDLAEVDITTEMSAYDKQDPTGVFRPDAMCAFRIIDAVPPDAYACDWYLDWTVVKLLD